jgi:hypothetical protein
MGQRIPALNETLKAFIGRQRIYFVGTAAADGRVNVSPKGLDTLRVLGDNRIVWLNLTGSGNETAAHLMENERMTVMFCSFEGDPLILRLYGYARSIHTGDDGWNELIATFPPFPGPRQVIDMHVDLVQTSCGAGVPLYDFVGDRDQMTNWLADQGEEGIKAYWREVNAVSLDGRPTGIDDYAQS